MADWREYCIYVEVPDIHWRRFEYSDIYPTLDFRLGSHCPMWGNKGFSRIWFRYPDQAMIVKLMFGGAPLDTNQ